MSSKTVALKKKKQAPPHGAKRLAKAAAAALSDSSIDPGKIGEGYIPRAAIKRMARRGGIRSFREKKEEERFYATFRACLVHEIERIAEVIPHFMAHDRRMTVYPKDVLRAIAFKDGVSIYGAQSKNKY